MSETDYANITIVSGNFSNVDGTIISQNAFVTFEYNKQSMRTTVVKNKG